MQDLATNAHKLICSIWNMRMSAICGRLPFRNYFDPLRDQLAYKRRSFVYAHRGNSAQVALLLHVWTVV